MKTLEIRIRLNESLANKGYPQRIVIEKMPETSGHDNNIRLSLAECDIRIIEEHPSHQPKDKESRSHTVCSSHGGYGEIIHTRKSGKNQ